MSLANLSPSGRFNAMTTDLTSPPAQKASLLFPLIKTNFLDDSHFLRAEYILCAIEILKAFNAFGRLSTITPLFPTCSQNNAST